MTFKWAFERHLHYLKGMAFQNAALDFTLTHDNQAAESVATLRKFFHDYLARDIGYGRKRLAEAAYPSAVRSSRSAMPTKMPTERWNRCTTTRRRGVTCLSLSRVSPHLEFSTCTPGTRHGTDAVMQSRSCTPPTA